MLNKSIPVVISEQHRLKATIFNTLCRKIRKRLGLNIERLLLRGTIGILSGAAVPSWLPRLLTHSFCSDFKIKLSYLSLKKTLIGNVTLHIFKNVLF